MSYIKFLKKQKLHHATRWVVKYNKETDTIREVKMIFNPEAYRKGSKARPLHTQNGLIKILENERRKQAQ